MENIVADFNELLVNNNLSELTEKDINSIRNLWDLIHNEEPYLPLWGGPERALELNEIVKNKDNQRVLKHKLFLIANNSSVHQYLLYARQLTAFRVIQAINDLLYALKKNRIVAAVSSLRLALESIGSFYYIVFNKVQTGLNKIKKLKLESEENNIKIFKLMSDILEEMNGLTVKMQVDWVKYIEDQNVEEYKVEEGFYDAGVKRGDFLGNIRNINSTVIPHNSADWGIVYKFFCDFCHPSVGSRIAIDSDKSEYIINSNITFRKTKLSFSNSRNEIIDKLIIDILKYSINIIYLFEDIDNNAINIQSELSQISRKFVRNAFKYDKLFFKNVVKKQYDPYSRCVCLNKEKFKFCCGNEKNW